MRACIWLFSTVFLLVGCDVGPAPAEKVDRSKYPEGPYGKEEGDILENVKFVSTEGDEVSFGDIFKEEKRKLLLFNTAAGWCAACRDEQPTLQSLHEDNASKGLAVMVALFENQASVVADEAFAKSWVEQYDLDFDVVVDAEFQMGAYYADPSATPLTLVIDLNTMEILLKSTGFPKSDIEALVEAKL